jgi:type III pantothenate kinase
MIGIIDIGNSTYHCGIFENNFLKEDLRTIEITDITHFFSKIKRILCISVAPERKKRVEEIATFDIISFPSNFVQLDYKSEPGEDRLANGLGVKVELDLPAIVVDCGSAITIDLFSQSTDAKCLVKFEGGAIMMGLSSYFSSVSKTGAQIPKISPELYNKTGKNTEECLRLGAFGSLVGGIKEILQILDYKNKNLIFTGGDGEIFSKYFKAKYDPALTLKGGLVAYNGIS